MLYCTRRSVFVQAEQLLDQRSPEDDFAQQLRMAVYMIARDYVKARQEALEAKQAVKEAMQRTDRVAAEARQDVKEAVQEVKELSMQLGSARATLRQTEIRLEERTLDAAKDCSAMYARVIIEWFELSRRISGPRQKAWSEYLKDNPEFNIRLQDSCGKHFDGKWDVGVQKAYQTLSSYIHNCPPVLYGGSGNERILILSDAIPSFVGCLVQFLANEVLSIKIRVQYK